MSVMQSDEGTTDVHTKGPKAFAVTEILFFSAIDNTKWQPQ